MSGITTHVLDTSRGRPAAGISVALESRTADHDWKLVAAATTDADGRAKQLLPPGTRLEAGTYRLRFGSGAYFRAQNIECFHPEIVIEFTVRDAAQNYHVPVLISPFGYTTYRGT